jgi:cbb3-type cytochrome oxidase cytochrome c subunit
VKSIWSFILAAAVVIAVLFFISSMAKKAPDVPTDKIHTRSRALRESCVVCHAPGKQAPLKDTHPPKEECFACHKINKS